MLEIPLVYVQLKESSSTRDFFLRSFPLQIIKLPIWGDQAMQNNANVWISPHTRALFGLVIYDDHGFL